MISHCEYIVILKILAIIAGLINLIKSLARYIIIYNIHDIIYTCT